MAVEKIKDEFGLKMNRDETNGLIAKVIGTIAMILGFVLESIKDTVYIVFRQK